MISNYSELASTWALDIFPHLFWVIFGGVQIVLAFGLVLPGIMKRYYKLTFISAIGLSLISLSGIALYAAYIGVGILWAIIPAILAGFVAYGRGCKCET